MKYHLARGSEKLGEFNDLDISAGLRDGSYKPTDLCWAASMKDWEPLSERFGPVEPTAEVHESTATALDEATTPMSRTGDADLASLVQRFAAWALDWLTVMPAMMLFSKALALDQFIEKNQHLRFDQLLLATNGYMEKFAAEHPDSLNTPFQLIFGLILVNAVLLSLRGQTIGKWFMGIRIVKAQTGLNPGFVSAFLLRSVVLFVLTLIPFAGRGLMFFDTLCIFRRDRRCLHDLIADTVVVKVR
jgi:uncharacterized RDD family membrane protein YckC